MTATDTPIVPRRCRLVHEALSGLFGETDFTRQNRCWRYIDLIKITGRNSSERKLRELITACPGMVASETRKGEDGTRYKVFWLVMRRYEKKIIEPVTTETPGQLFDLPEVEQR